MVDPLTSRPHSSLVPVIRLLAAGLCLFVVSAMARAQTLTDPTRPPAQLLRADDGADGNAAALASGLQSVKIAKGRKSAMINGEVVKLGGKVGESVLVAIGDSEVKLRQPDGTFEILKMYPEIDIKRVVSKKAQRAHRTPVPKQPHDSQK